MNLIRVSCNQQRTYSTWGTAALSCLHVSSKNNSYRMRIQTVRVTSGRAHVPAGNASRPSISLTRVLLSLIQPRLIKLKNITNKASSCLHISFPMCLLLEMKHTTHWVGLRINYHALKKKISFRRKQIVNWSTFKEVCDHHRFKSVACNSSTWRAHNFIIRFVSDYKAMTVVKHVDPSIRRIR